MRNSDHEHTGTSGGGTMTTSGGITGEPADERAGTVAALARRGAAVYGTQWWRYAAVAAITSAAALGVVLFAMSGLPTLAGGQRDLIVDEVGQVRLVGLVAILAELGLPVAIAAGLLFATWLGAAARLTDAALDDGHASVAQAMGRGVRRIPAVAGAGVIALVAVAVLALATPLLMLAGAVGLVGAPVAASTGSAATTNCRTSREVITTCELAPAHSKTSTSARWRP